MPACSLGLCFANRDQIAVAFDGFVQRSMNYGLVVTVDLSSASDEVSLCRGYRLLTCRFVLAACSSLSLFAILGPYL